MVFDYILLLVYYIMVKMNLINAFRFKLIKIIPFYHSGNNNNKLIQLDTPLY